MIKQIDINYTCLEMRLVATLTLRKKTEHIDSLIVVSKPFSLLQITPLLTYSIIPAPFHLYPFWHLFHNHSYQTVQIGSYHLFLFHLRQSNLTGRMI